MWPLRGDFDAVGAPKVALEIYQVWRDEAWTGCRAVAALAPRTVSQSPSLCITCSVTNVQKHVSSKRRWKRRRRRRQKTEAKATQTLGQTVSSFFCSRSHSMTINGFWSAAQAAEESTVQLDSVCGLCVDCGNVCMSMCVLPRCTKDSNSMPVGVECIASVLLPPPAPSLPLSLSSSLSNSK